MAAEVANAIVKSVTLRKATRTRQEAQELYDERLLIARAQGVLMAIEDCSAAQAARLIANAAHENGERLAATAERILANVIGDEEHRMADAATDAPESPPDGDTG